MPTRDKKKPGPQPTLPKREIVELHVGGMKSSKIAEVLQMRPQAVYDAIWKFRSNDDYDKAISEIREHAKSRIMATTMVAAKRMEKLLDIDTEELPQVAMAQVKAADSIYDRSGIIPEKAKEGIDINILIYQQNGWG